MNVNLNTYLNMKKILLILCVITFALQNAEARSVNYPTMRINTTDKNSQKITICGVDILPECTIVRMSYETRAGYWVYIAKNTALKTDGKSYQVIDSEGIPLGEEYTAKTTGILEFSLTFPPIPDDTRSIDIIESDEWQFLGIDLTEGKNREQYFAQFSNKTPDFEYTYLSPLMLKTIPGKSHYPGATKIEMVTTGSKGRDPKLVRAINDAINANNMELISKESNEKKGNTEFYGVWDERRNQFSKLLIIQIGDTKEEYSGLPIYGASLKALYMEGNFKMEEMQTFIEKQKESSLSL